MLRLLGNKSFRIVAGLALLTAVYAVAGFVVAPKLVRSALLEDIPQAIGASPAVGEIHINPFLLRATVDDFSLAGAGGERLLGFKRLYIDFELSSIWHRAYSFANIDITAPYVSAVMAKDGSLNLAQLRPRTPPQPKRDEGGKPIPALRIGSFHVSQGLVTYEDRSRPDVFAARLEPINFELREFKTGIEGGKFTFTGSSKLGERIEWHGHLSVQPVESDGEFQVDGLLAHTLWEYLQDRLNFDIRSGIIDLAATYKFSLKDAATDNLQVDVSRLALRDLAVRPKDSGTVHSESAKSEPDWITLPSLTVAGTTVDLQQRRAHVDLVSLTGIKLVARLESDGTVNLMQLTAPPGGAHGSATAPAVAPVTPTLTAQNAPPAASQPWTYDLREFDLRDASVSVEDRTTQPAVKVLLAPLSLQANGLSQDMTKPVALTVDMRIDAKGSVSATGEVTPQPLMANLRLKLADIDLTAVQPYLAQHTAMTLLGGTLGADANLHYGVQKSGPALQFAGNIQVEKLHTVDDALHDDFVDWDRLDILGVNYSQGPDRLDIDQIVARKLYARVIIESDATSNVKRVLKIPAGGVAPHHKASSAATTGKPGRSAGDGGAKPAAQTASAVPTKPIPMSIKKIVVQDGEADFADLSVVPNFSAGIQKLAGTVTGLSSRPGSRAKVDLKGAVDAFSPVSITGDINVLGPLYTDLILSFRNISLPVFNPYSGKFAGYDIAKGKLTTELHYKVDGRKLDAQHHIIVEQLEFGDKTASKDAVSLPIKLAVALLKDRNGVIDLNLPVSGTLDDPTFKLGAVIWEVFVHLLEKAVTAPFALLGSLFGSGPDIQFIDFQPGAAGLDASAIEKAKAVSKALLERPQLKIDVPIAVVAALDGPALAARRFDSELSAARAAKDAPKKAGAAGGYDELDPKTQLELLTSVYAQDLGGAPAFPDAVTHLKSKPEVVAAKVEFLSKAIREHIVIGDDDLQKLGQQRAMALQQALLADSQVEPERVFLVANDKATAKDGAVRLELSLQ